MRTQVTLLAFLLSCIAAADEPQNIEALGDERYRIGSIVIDKASGTFEVPGRMLNVDETLEYLAVSTNGIKGYESLLELDASPTEFNLACILIGLDDENAVEPRYQFDENEIRGMGVSITLQWQEGEDTVTLPIERALRTGDKVFDNPDWIYIGSFIDESGTFTAETDGSLIGFVHDPVAIIDHRTGIGIGDYGLVTGNAAALPPEGSPVRMRIAIND